jgi:hypothetical protein
MKAQGNRIGSRFRRVLSPAAVAFIALGAVELGLLTRGHNSSQALLIPVAVFSAALVAGALYGRARAQEHWRAAWDAYAELDLAQGALLPVHDERALSMAATNGTAGAI